MKQILKPCARILFALCALPIVIWYRVWAIVLGRAAAFRGASEFLALCPGTFGVYLRYAFLRRVLAECGTDVCVSSGTVFSHPGARLGNSVYVGNYCSVGDVTLEDDVLLASHVSLMNGTRQHGIDRLDVPVREQAGDWVPITIGRDSWIGERAVVSANVGKHCIVGAGTVVTKPVPDYAIVVGVPAKIIGDRRNLVADKCLNPAGETAVGRATQN